MQSSVSIIMATFNRAHFIAETIESIQKQTFKNFECLIIDDGSTDNTFEIVQPVIETDQRFKYFKRTEKYKKGLPGSRNYGLDLAKGDFIVFFDDDDCIHSKNLEINTKILETEGIDFCSYQKKPFFDKLPKEQDEESIIIENVSSENVFQVISGQISIASCTVLWKKNCFENIRFNENLMYAEEWECYTRIISNQFRGVQINNILYFNRKHSNSNTGEFYSNNSIQRKSKNDAVLLIAKNLNSKKLISTDIIRYFVQVSYKFRDYKLFQHLMKELNLPFLKRFYWNIYYQLLQLKKKIAKTKKKIQK